MLSLTPFSWCGVRYRRDIGRFRCDHDEAVGVGLIKQKHTVLGVYGMYNNVEFSQTSSAYRNRARRGFYGEAKILHNESWSRWMPGLNFHTKEKTRQLENHAVICYRCDCSEELSLKSWKFCIMALEFIFIKKFVRPNNTWILGSVR